MQSLLKADLEKLNKFAPKGVHFGIDKSEYDGRKLVYHAVPGVGRGEYDEDNAAIFVYFDELHGFSNRDFNADNGFLTHISINELNKTTERIMKTAQKESLLDAVKKEQEKHPDYSLNKAPMDSRAIDTLVFSYKKAHQIAKDHDAELEKGWNSEVSKKVRDLSQKRNDIYKNFNMGNIVMNAYIQFLFSKEYIIEQTKKDLGAIGKTSGTVIADKLVKFKKAVKNAKYDPIFTDKQTSEKYNKLQEELKQGKTNFTAAENAQIIKTFIDKDY
ncbi:MAG: hypothetical protein LBJ18_01790 [Rickettsiales bacterium]|jgi:hypothetical protein|nr:hypothetical protein [Rickettsiales bacterium]